MSSLVQLASFAGESRCDCRVDEGLHLGGDGSGRRRGSGGGRGRGYEGGVGCSRAARWRMEVARVGRTWADCGTIRGMKSNYNSQKTIPAGFFTGGADSSGTGIGARFARLLPFSWLAFLCSSRSVLLRVDMISMSS